MSAAEPTTLEEVIRAAGEDRLIDDHEPRSEAMPRVLRLLHQTRELAEARGLTGFVSLDEPGIVREYSRNDFRVKAFLQALQITDAPEMLLMVWRILQGAFIDSIHVAYARVTGFEMRVVLQSSYNEGEEVYQSSVGTDFRLLRHVSVIVVEDQPIFDGFYAQR